jgi:hypothetical protein
MTLPEVVKRVGEPSFWGNHYTVPEAVQAVLNEFMADPDFTLREKIQVIIDKRFDTPAQERWRLFDEILDKMNPPKEEP